MCRLFAGLGAGVLAIAGVLLVASPAVGDANKVYVWHKGKLIRVAEQAVPALLAIGGCVPGEEVCDGVDNDCNGDVDEGDVCPALLGCYCSYGSEVLSLGMCIDSAADCTVPEGLCDAPCLVAFGAVFGPPSSTVVVICQRRTTCDPPQ